ncbi:hypothetical protein GCM10020254_19750 [Streptomyces goshikiensis]
MLRDPLLDVPQRLPPGRLRGQLGAELGLVARSAQEDHQVPGDQQRHVPSVVLLHQREREVDPGRDPGRGRDPAVPYVDRVRLDGHGRVVPGHQRARIPVGGGPAAVQQPGLGEQERAGAHRHQPLRATPRGPAASR